jgi:type IV pilus assembly protein PilV
MRNNGFTLLEVLIAMVVLAVGLLGLAAMQATGLKNSLSAYQRSQATQLAYDMADRMRANAIETRRAENSTYDKDIKALAAATDQDTCKSVAGTPGVCSVAQMAEKDLFEWRNELNNTLSGSGEIDFVDPVFTITVSWDDDRDSTTPAFSFQMSFLI